MSRNSVALLGIFSVIIIIFMFAMVRELIKSQEKEVRQLIEYLSFITAHPLQFGMTMILPIIWVSFNMREATTLLCIFCVILIPFCAKVGELMGEFRVGGFRLGELREAVGYIAAHRLLFGMLIIIKITAFIWFISSMRRRIFKSRLLLSRAMGNFQGGKMIDIA